MKVTVNAEYIFKKNLKLTLIKGKIGLPSSYSVPTAQILLTDTEIIIPTRGGVIAYDKQSNSETWRIPTTKYLTVPNPYITYDGR